MTRFGGSTHANANSYEIWSMTNIAQSSPLCWFHFVGICIMTSVTIYFLEKEFVVYAKHRHVYLRQVCSSVHDLYERSF
jgi:hypothetical protein